MNDGIEEKEFLVIPRKIKIRNEIGKNRKSNKNLLTNHFFDPTGASHPYVAYSATCSSKLYKQTFCRTTHINIHPYKYTGLWALKPRMIEFIR